MKINIQKKTFDYDNIFIACNGGERDGKPVTLHCDSKKDNNEPSPICPNQIDCAKQFRYFSNGTIEGLNEEATQTIKELGLNIKNSKYLESEPLKTILKSL